MSLHKHRSLPSATSQQGMALTSVMLALVITTLLAVLGSVELVRRVNDSAAAATGRYLLAVREALIAFQIRHEAWLSGIDTSTSPAGTYPDAPPLSWSPGAGGVSLAYGSVELLQAQGLLSATLPTHPPLGERVAFLLVRQGVCPGADCQVASYAYTCHPINHISSSKTSMACLAPDTQRARYDPGLLGQVLISTDGYGGHDALNTTRFMGPLIDVDRRWFPVSAHPGHAIVVAALNATPFGQFVRMGDTRAVQLHHTLSVAGALQTQSGLLINTQVALGAACTTPRMIALSHTQALAMCTHGIWSLIQGKTVQAVWHNLVHGAYVAPPVCSPPATPFRHLSLSATDVTVTGPNLNVHGQVGGNVSGSGSVNAAGHVDLTGSFAGSFQANPSSSIRVTQSVTLSASHQVLISPAGPNARASLIQGCLS